MYDVDVNGTHNVLEAAAQAGTQQVLVTSSAVAYGAFPDNPVPLTEDDPVRGVRSFSYARDKTESDRLCQLWAAKHPDRVMTIVRPCIVFGPNVDNYLVRLWTKQPFAVDAGTLDSEIQFVHEDDVVEAHHRAAARPPRRRLQRRRRRPDDHARVRRADRHADPQDAAARLPRARADDVEAARLSEAPPGAIEFALHPWIVSNEKLKRTTGWTPRHSSRETFEITMRAHGKLPPAEPPATGSSGNGLRPGLLERR